MCRGPPLNRARPIPILGSVRQQDPAGSPAPLTTSFESNAAVTNAVSGYTVLGPTGWSARGLISTDAASTGSAGVPTTRYLYVAPAVGVEVHLDGDLPRAHRLPGSQLPNTRGTDPAPREQCAPGPNP